VQIEAVVALQDRGPRPLQLVQRAALELLAEDPEVLVVTSELLGQSREGDHVGALLAGSHQLLAELPLHQGDQPGVMVEVYGVDPLLVRRTGQRAGRLFAGAGDEGEDEPEDEQVVVGQVSVLVPEQAKLGVQLRKARRPRALRSHCGLISERS
jgi:hypothetical protein